MARCAVLLFQLSPALTTLWTVAHPAPLSTGFSRQEYWSGLPTSSRGSSQPSNQTCMSFTFPALAGRFFTTLHHLESPEIADKALKVIVTVFCRIHFCEAGVKMLIKHFMSIKHVSQRHETHKDTN